MLLCFTLRMPGNNAWDGKWSGADKLYAIIKSFRGVKGLAQANTILDGSSYSYNFGDGWRASVEVKEVNASAARKIRAKSQGFCGYDWMVRSILDCGRICA